jgi:hypothetical protein
VLNVVIHVIGLGLINESVVRILSGTMERRGFLARFAVVLGVTALLATVLLGIEAAIWATANRDRSPKGSFRRLAAPSRAALSNRLRSPLGDDGVAGPPDVFRLNASGFSSTENADDALIDEPEADYVDDYV